MRWRVKTRMRVGKETEQERDLDEGKHKIERADNKKRGDMGI
jgi:hypothetical protein